MPRHTPNGTATQRILHVVGARPNFMKMAPVHRALAAYPNVQSLILHTGQHYDRLMSDVFFEDLQLPLPDVSLGVGSGTHAEQTAGIMVALERHVTTERPDLAVVYGDVNSTMAAALVCAKLGIPCAHVEAGLRSGDRTMPEEINRIVTDRIADLLLVTEPSGRRNLEREGVAPEAIVDTGNVMIDSLAALLEREGIAARRPRRGRGLVLVTLHRPSNVDDLARFAEIASFLERLATEYDVLFPVHPRTRKQIEATQLGARLAERTQLLEPLRYRDFVLRMTEASLIVTDSGGIQEESAYLGVPCLTLRTTTERPITVDAGTNILEPSCDGDLAGAAAALMDRDYPPIGQNAVLRAAQWDGHAGERVARALRKFLSG
jgi:UDP-N-acetylglucosamine 2-epimerase (non-hydrolysing)